MVDETWYTDETSREDDKKLIKSVGHGACFDVTMLTCTCYLGPFDKNGVQSKIRRKR